MSRTRIAMIVLLLLIGTPIGLVLLRPELVLQTLAKSTLDELGYEITQLDVLHLGINSTAIQQLTLSSEDQSVALERIHAQYSLSQLFGGTLQSVSVGQVKLRSQSDSAAPDAELTTLSSLLESFDALAVNELVLPNVELTDSAQSYKIGMGIQSPPLRLVGEAQTESLTDTIIEFDVQRTATRELTVESRALFAGELLAEADISLSVLESGIAVSASSSILLEVLQTQLAELLPATTVILSDSLSLQSNFEVQEVFGKPTISQLHLLLDSASSRLDIRQQSDLGVNTLYLRLPISAEGALATSNGEVQLSFSEIVGTGSWEFDDASVQSEHTFSDAQLQCTSPASCALQSEWRSNLGGWRYGDYLGENTSFSAPLRFTYSNDEMRLAADRVLIQIPTIRSSSASTFSELATTLQLDAVEFRVGDVISGGFEFSSEEFRLDNELAILSNPAYSGKLQLEEDVLTGIMEIDLDQRLRLGIGLQHFFLRDTGDVVLQLAAYEFTETEPLSALIKPKQIDADLVAGRIEGLANISWSKQLDESWRFGGPIALKIEQLSGYYADYLFVDLDTDLFAEATTPLGVQVTNPASASLSRIDIGLPLENLAWQYRFDTVSNDVQITDFETALLGGKLSIPAARYNPSRERQQIDVVLADLRVDSLVSLADYPELYADGLISGYLPFIIEGDKINIERGLIGALKPGGNIRYTPASSAPSSNQSLQLVNDALSNYQYQTMNTDVSYSEDGELLLGVQLRGSNPDMNNGQAINLNVNISDNIPSLLRSLQASRVITDELERLVGKP